jgi:hypothetical protein
MRMLLRGVHYSLHSSQQVIAKSDSEEAISKRDCHGLRARNETFLVAPNVTYFMLPVIIIKLLLDALQVKGFK